MKRKDLEKILKANGYELERSGGNHDIFTNGKKKVPIPRHKEIREATVKAIFKEANIE